MRVGSLGREDLLEKEMAIHFSILFFFYVHSSILAWRIPWTEEPGELPSMGSQRVGHDWVTEHRHRHVSSKTLIFFSDLYTQWSGLNYPTLQEGFFFFTEFSSSPTGAMFRTHYAHQNHLVQGLQWSFLLRVLKQIWKHLPFFSSLYVKSQCHKYDPIVIVWNKLW